MHPFCPHLLIIRHIFVLWLIESQFFPFSYHFLEFISSYTLPNPLTFYPRELQIQKACFQLVSVS